MINVCITGHRPNKLYGYNMNNPKYDYLRKVIYNVIEKLYYKYNKRITLINGGALGVDQIFARESIKLKDKYNSDIDSIIKLILVKPCMNQDVKWDNNSKREYIDICNNMDDIICISKEYTNTCLQKRNIYMVDNSDIVIVVLNNSNNNNNDNNNKSGTSNCYNYAKNKKDKDIILIDPVSFNVTIIKKDEKKERYIY